jgi:hypothetical protein
MRLLVLAAQAGNWCNDRQELLTTMPGNDTLRRKLNSLIETTEATYQRAWDILQQEETHSVRPVRRPDPYYNCHAFALGIDGNQEYGRMVRRWSEPETMVSSAFMEKLRDNRVLLQTGKATYAPGELVLYSDGRRIAHSAQVISADNRLHSKWGSGRVYDHVLWEVPLPYGNDYKVVTSPALAVVMAELRVWVAGYGY